LLVENLHGPVPVIVPGHENMRTFAVMLRLPNGLRKGKLLVRTPVVAVVKGLKEKYSVL